MLAKILILLSATFYLTVSQAALITTLSIDTVEYNGQYYELSIVSGTFTEYQDEIEASPWWGDIYAASDWAISTSSWTDRFGSFYSTEATFFAHTNRSRGYNYLAHYEPEFIRVCTPAIRKRNYLHRPGFPKTGPRYISVPKVCSTVLNPLYEAIIVDITEDYVLAEFASRWGNCYEEGSRSSSYLFFTKACQIDHSEPTEYYAFASLIEGGSVNYDEIDVIIYDGIQSVPVPEPSTLAIFALGIIGLASRRFKKQL